MGCNRTAAIWGQRLTEVRRELCCASQTLHSDTSKGVTPPPFESRYALLAIIYQLNLIDAHFITSTFLWGRSMTPQ